MTLTCNSCDRNTLHTWIFKSKVVCGDCLGHLDKAAMCKMNAYRMYMDRNEVRNASGTFRIGATIQRGNSDVFPSVDHVQIVFDQSVWHGIISPDNVYGEILLKRTKKRYLKDGEEI